jgi:hypothetical protein
MKYSFYFFTFRDKGQKESEFSPTNFYFLPAAIQPEKINADKPVIFYVGIDICAFKEGHSTSQGIFGVPKTWYFTERYDLLRGDNLFYKR